MNALECEDLIKEFTQKFYLDVIIEDLIIDHYRHDNLQYHLQRFKETNNHLKYHLIYLNSSKHPGYVVFFHGPHLREFL